MDRAPPLLVRLPNYVGDTVCALPALHRLAAAGPLLALGRPWAVPLLAAAGLPARAVPRGRWARIATLREAARDRGTRRLLLMTHSFSSALEARLAGLSPIGFTKDGRRGLLATNAGPLPGGHLVEDYQRLADACIGAASPTPSGPAWPGPTADTAFLAARRQRLAAHGLDGAPYALIVPVAGGQHGGASKDWPHLPAIVSTLRDAGLRILAAPGPGETAAFAASLPDATLVEGLDLADLGLLAAGARLVVAPDSGQAHLAAAAGACGIAVFGPTRPARSRPWSTRFEVMGGDGRWPSVDEVRAAVERRLAG